MEMILIEGLPGIRTPIKIGKTAYRSSFPETHTASHRQPEALLEEGDGPLKIGSYRRHDTEHSVDLGQATN